MTDRKTLLTRRQWLGMAGAAGVASLALGTDAFAIAPNRLTLTRHALGKPRGGGATLRMVQLSDLHLERVGIHEESIAESVASLQPDLILLTGDVLDRAEHVRVVSDFMQLLGPRTQKLAILGNWEHWSHVRMGDLERVYARSNCQLLLNESVTVRAHGASFTVTGLDDLVAGTPDYEHALQRGATVGDNHLLLQHCPALRDMVEWSRLPRPQYMFSGHTHGGQIAPFGRVLFLPPGSGGYVSGWYGAGDEEKEGAAPPLYVSRGLGTSTIPARIGALPEVAYFEWTAA